MSFLQKYLIASKVEEAEETMSFRAHDTLTGQQVLLHQIVPGRTPPEEPELSAMILHYFPGGGEPGTEHFREVGKDEDRMFVVTADVPECVDLRQWLYTIAAAREDRGVLPEPSSAQSAWPQNYAAAPAAPPAPPASPELKAEPEVRPPDKSTRSHIPSGFEVVYQSRKQTPTHASPAPEALAPTRVISTSGHEAASDDEFAKLFAGTGDQAPASAPPPAGQKAAPGKFTQMFSAISQPNAGQPVPPASPAAGTPSSAPPSPDQKARPGKFTQMFAGIGQPNAGQPISPSPPAAGAPPGVPASPGQKSGPGQFTQMFAAMGQPGAAPPLPPPPPAAGPIPGAPPSSGPKSSPGGFTQMFSAGEHLTPAEPLPPSPPAAGPPLSAPPSPPAASKPVAGEFTRQFAGASLGPSSQSPTSLPAAPSGPSSAPSPPPPAGKAGPGSFTQMFQASAVGAESPADSPLSPAKPQAPMPASSGSAGGAGGFSPTFPSGGDPVGGTRSPGFGGPSQPTPPLPGSKKGPGELTALMQGYKGPTGAAAATPPPALEAPPPRPAAPEPAKGPGEYTLMFRRLRPLPPRPSRAPTPACLRCHACPPRLPEPRHRLHR